MCLSRSSRCIPNDAERSAWRRRFRARRTRAWRLRAQGHAQRGQQRGSLFVPIHWSGETASCGTRRRTGAAAHRSAFRPAGSEGDAGAHRAGRISPIAALRARASRIALPAGTWWARVAVARRTGIPVRDQARSDALARTRIAHLPARRARRIHRRRTASIAPRRSSTAGSKAPVRRPGRCASHGMRATSFAEIVDCGRSARSSRDGPSGP